MRVYVNFFRPVKTRWAGGYGIKTGVDHDIRGDKGEIQEEEGTGLLVPSIGTGTVDKKRK